MNIYILLLVGLSLVAVGINLGVAWAIEVFDND